MTGRRFLAIDLDVEPAAPQRRQLAWIELDLAGHLARNVARQSQVDERTTGNPRPLLNDRWAFVAGPDKPVKVPEMESVFPSRVADALPLPVMIGCVASLNGMADKYTWYLSAAVASATTPENGKMTAQLS